ncbi:16S rRNA (cytidine(1402)-2'-O)-methyltransferase [Oxalobacter sp. OxGP1]|uniref:16S rRNA (cytidine(1402)-2'-O)-methyltransferase n=1 Tax=Oxalobacter paeniformigenes TaxID=2946594 RepID=UPI0022AFE1D6|nr:16S rRNA (cytidine(1402)-2'-O)-methyltransferase [Oxalobacter paeniformigenes]MCZ4052912.1 16S rRNA (cytidine(1402)-2'-O)-methyltransferase [Oxalobacter paeniformigenes]
MESLSHQHYPDATLYVIGTPIGNAGDISLRALHILEITDAVACEDTRVTKNLLGLYGLDKELISAHQHNEREAAEKLIARLQRGERIALVSDAGTPAISDPGAKIVDSVRNAGFNVIPVPGPSAAITALSAGGLIDESFLFIGFLPAKTAQRQTVLRKLKDSPATLVIYEAPHRIRDTVRTLADIFEPSRTVVIARELTKLFEEIHRCPLSEAIPWLEENRNRQKGEFVLLVQGAPSREDDESQARHILSVLLDELPAGTAAGLTAKITGIRKNRLYDMALELKKTD